MELTYVEIFETPGLMTQAIQVASTARALALQGHRVRVFLRPLVKGAGRPEAIAAWFEESFGWQPPEGLVVETLVATHKGAAGLDFRRRLLAQLVRRGPRAVFYGRNRRQTLELARARKLIRRRGTIVYEVHNLEHVLAREERGAEAGERVRAEERRLYDEVDGLVAVSAPLADDLRAAFAPSVPLEIVPDGVDLERFRGIASPFERGDGTVTVVYAGSLYPHKGVEALVRALAELPERVRLELVGGNPPEELERLRRIAADVGVEGRVAFAGTVAPRAVADRLARADLVALPAGPETRTQRYTSPLKLFEAMATGAPIVAAPTAALTSVLADGRTAFVAPDCEAGGLAAAARRALEDTGAARAIGAAAREAAEAFGWDERARRIAAFCERCARRDAAAQSTR